MMPGLVAEGAIDRVSVACEVAGAALLIRALLSNIVGCWGVLLPEACDVAARDAAIRFNLAPETTAHGLVISDTRGISRQISALSV